MHRERGLIFIRNNLFEGLHFSSFFLASFQEVRLIGIKYYEIMEMKGIKILRYFRGQEGKTNKKKRNTYILSTTSKSVYYLEYDFATLKQEASWKKLSAHFFTALLTRIIL